MAMDANTMMMFYGVYLVCTLMGAMILFSFQDIILSLKRKFNPKGCDVYVVNSSRQMLHVYQKPKDGTFKINNKTYIVNPKKIINLDEKTSEKVSKSLKQRRNRIESLLTKLNDTLVTYDIELEAIKKAGTNNGMQELLSAKETVQQRIDSMKEDLESGEEYFYHKKRASFFYIEGDPVPKNLFDNYSELDCDIIDNLVMSALTKDPKSQKEFEKMVKGIKLWLYVAAGGAVVACLILINMQQKGIKCLGVV